MVIAFGILGLISVILWLITSYKTDKPLPPPDQSVRRHINDHFAGRS